MQRRNTSGWHGSTSEVWISAYYPQYSCISRSDSKSIFAYDAGGYSAMGNFLQQSLYYTRPVVIVGSGLLYKRSKSFRLEGKYLRIFLKVKYKRSVIPSTDKVVKKLIIIIMQVMKMKVL